MEDESCFCEGGCGRWYHLWFFIFWLPLPGLRANLCSNSQVHGVSDVALLLGSSAYQIIVTILQRTPKSPRNLYASIADFVPMFHGN